MSLLLECPHCSQRFERDASLAGTNVLCPGCHKEMRVPAAAAPAAPEAHIVSTPSAAAPVSPAMLPPDTEETVLEFQPVARAFFWTVVMAVACVVSGLSAFPVLLTSTSTADWPRHVLLIPGLVVLLGLCLALHIWVAITSRHYRLTNQRLFVTRGLIARRTEEVELYRVKDVKVDQGLWERLLDYGAVTIYSTDESAPELVIPNIGSPVDVKEALRTHYRTARRAMGVRTTEFMES